MYRTMLYAGLGSRSALCASTRKCYITQKAQVEAHCPGEGSLCWCGVTLFFKEKFNIYKSSLQVKLQDKSVNGLVRCKRNKTLGLKKVASMFINSFTRVSLEFRQTL